MKRILGVLLTVVLMMGSVPCAFAAVATDADFWAKDSVGIAYDAGFFPDDLLMKTRSPMTRLDFCRIAVMFYETLQEKDAVPQGESPFKDCQDDAVTIAYELGIVSGVSKDTFAPNNILTRQQMAIMIVRTLKACEVDLAGKQKANNFSDVKNLSEAVQGYIGQLYGAGIVSGYDDKSFGTENKLTTQEAISAFVRAYQYCKTAEEENILPQKNTEPSDIPKDTEPEEPIKSTDDTTNASEQSRFGDEYTIKILEKEISLGQSKAEVKAVWGEPDRIDNSVYVSTQRYIYVNDYTNYFFVTFQGDVAVEIFTPTRNYAYQNIKGEGTIANISEMDYFSTVDHAGVIKGKETIAKFLLDFEGSLSGIVLQTNAFNEKDSLQSGLLTNQSKDVEAEVLDLIQVKRLETAVDLLNRNERLDRVAKAHSDDMVKNNYVAYDNQDGVTPFARIMNASFRFQNATEVITKQRGDVVQVYQDWIRTASKISSLTGTAVDSVGIGVSSKTKEIHVTIDLCGQLVDLLENK